MNVHQFPLNDCQREQPESDPVGQAIAKLTAATKKLMDLALVSENRERMANEADFRRVCHAMTTTQVIASLIEVRRIANGEIEMEDARDAI